MEREEGERRRLHLSEVSVYGIRSSSPETDPEVKMTPEVPEEVIGEFSHRTFYDDWVTHYPTTDTDVLVNQVTESS